jgi:hypothetical protein
MGVPLGALCGGQAWRWAGYTQQLVVHYHLVCEKEDRAVAATDTSSNEHILSAARSPGPLIGTGVRNNARRYRRKRKAGQGSGNMFEHWTKS